MNRDRIDWTAVRDAGEGQRAGTWFWIPFVVGLGLLAGAAISTVVGTGAGDDAAVGSYVTAGVLAVAGLAAVVTAFVIRRDFRPSDDPADKQAAVGTRPDNEVDVDSYWNR